MELKKLILPIGVLAGAGILFLYLKNKKKAIPTGSKSTPILADDPTKQPIYDEILKFMAQRLFENPYPSQGQGQVGGQPYVMKDSEKTWWANEKAIEMFNCMMPDMKKMSVVELNKLFDYLKNGVPTDVLKMNDLRSVAEKYPKAFDDHPCNNICTRPDGSKFSTNLPCNEAKGVESFNGLKGL